MKLRKAIHYAYATSSRADDLGFSKTGCYYVAQTMLREDRTWSPPFIAQGGEDYLDRADPDLLAFLAECDGEPVEF